MQEETQGSPPAPAPDPGTAPGREGRSRPSSRSPSSAKRSSSSRSPSTRSTARSPSAPSTSTTTRAVVRDDARATLDGNAAWLKKFRTVKILVEGHCDERGTEEYNLALGEKRAKAAQDYLLSLGIARRPDEDHLLRQEPAAQPRPRRGRLADEPARPVPDHREVSLAPREPRGLLPRRPRPGLGRAGQEQEGLRARLRRRPGPQAAGPGPPRPGSTGTPRRSAPSRTSSSPSPTSSGRRWPASPGPRRASGPSPPSTRTSSASSTPDARGPADLVRAGRALGHGAAPGRALRESEPRPAPPGRRSGRRPNPGPSPRRPAPVPAPTMSPQEAYSVAYNDYLKGNYDLAVDSFKLYRQQFPESPLADNALYWIGECRYSQRKYEEAIDAFDELIVAYPQGDKAAAAHLKKGLSFIELGRKPEALAALKLLVAKYPLEEESRHRPGQDQGAQRKMRDINSLNKVILVGRLGRQARDAPAPPAGPLGRLASPWPRTSGLFNPNTRESSDRTEWHKIKVFGKLAEFCEKYLAQGRQILIEGKLRTRSWQDKDGNKRYDDRGRGDEHRPPRQARGELGHVDRHDRSRRGLRQRRRRRGPAAGRPATRTSRPATRASPEAPGGPDDDIPF
ncbi:MAG: tol-pal system protein YbgF [Comamonadaceae bacterium]|nr:tol-pal system protein YbgF [Comamonadaceae bacterium]